MIRFGLFGFPVTVRPWFWLITVLLSGEILSPKPDYLQILLWVIAVFISILWHELGHAFFQRRYGMRCSIELHGFGGVAIGSGRYLTRPQNIMMSLAGPLAGFLLAAVFIPLAFLPLAKPANVFVIYMLWINVIWSAVNLLPMLPMDGGRVSAALFGSERKAARLGIIVAIGLLVVCLVMQTGPFGMIFLVYLAYLNYQHLEGGIPRYRSWG